MGLHESLQKLKFDKRLLDFYLRNNQLSEKELEAYFQSLPDNGNNTAPLDISGNNTPDNDFMN